MARSFLTNINMNLNQLLNALMQVLSVAPSSPPAGQFYYSSTTNAGYVWNGTTWASMDATKATGIPTSAIANLQNTIQGYSLSSFAAPTANIPMAGYTLSGLPAPSAAGQAAEYSWVIGQVQSAASGIVSKDPVNAVSTTNIATLSGTITVDGVALTAGQRLLLVAQSTASQNGPWVIQSGAWTRPTTEGGAAELDLGATWLSLSGTSNAGTLWRISTPVSGTITPGTTSITIVQFLSGITYTNGAGLTLSGNAFAVNPIAGGGILASASGVQIDTTVVTRKFSATIGDGTATSYTVTHNLNTQDVMMQVKQAVAPFGEVECDMQATSTTTATFIFASAPASGAYRVIVLG